MEEYRFVVSEEYENERIDKYIASLLPDSSRTFIQKLIKEEKVLINKAGAKASAKININDEVVITIPDPIIPKIEAQKIPIDVVYEDEAIMIVNKAKNMVVHPAPSHYSDTLVNAIMYHCHDLSGINGIMRPGIVHRIDKDTTGLLVICKNDFAHSCLAEQFKEHSIERTYHAIVKGNIKADLGTIDKPIGRDANDRKKMCINSNGKNAITHFTVLERFGNYTYIKCNLETGRTHQIRVHMASIGFPLLGDEVYGNKSKEFNTNGQTLHAKTLGFVHPNSNEWVQFDSNLPEYFDNILKRLRT